MTRDERKDAILRVISESEITTQEELCAALLAENFDVTQATVSRDIRQLGLYKERTESGKLAYACPHPLARAGQSRFIRVIKDGAISAAAAQNIVVIKTSPGMAMAVAAALDNVTLPGIEGTIAGDDTIMSVARTKRDAERAAAALSEFLI